MTVRRRILSLAPFPPRLDAVHGGGRAVGHLLAGLAQNHDVRLLCVRGTDEPGTDRNLHARCHSVEEFVRPAPTTTAARLQKKGRSLRNALIGLPTWASRSRVPGFGARVREISREWRPEIVQFEFHVMGQYARSVGSDSVKLLTQHEPGIPAALDTLGSARGWDRPVAWLDALAWRHFEPRVLARMDSVVTFTERDAEAVRTICPGATVDVVPLGTLVPDEPLDPVGSAPGSIVYIGNYRHPPNVQAALRLARDILPRVRDRIPGAELTLVGPEPPKEILELSGPSVRVTGEVPSVQPFLNEAAVVAAPISRGGGMRVKVLEALAAGKALVASPLAVEGIPVRHGEQVWVAEGDDEFADALVVLLNDPDRRARLAGGGRRWAEREVGWSQAVARYEVIYRTLLEAPGRPGPERGSVSRSGLR